MYYTLDIILKFCNFPKLLQYPLALYSHPKDYSILIVITECSLFNFSSLILPYNAQLID